MKRFYSSVKQARIIVVVAAALMFCALPGCQQEEVDTDIGWGYFPTEIGHWVVYEIDSTVYDDFTGDTFYYRYQVKELLESEFIDNEGRLSVRVERYRRNYDSILPYDSIPWYLSRVYAFTRSNGWAEKLEENVRYIRLAFPVEQGKTWNGNAYNTIGQWNYKYRAVDEDYTIASFALDSTLLVEQKNEINLISHRVYKERYAKNIGLIEKNVIDVRDTGFGSVPVLNRIYSGVIYDVTLVDYGPR